MRCAILIICAGIAVGIWVVNVALILSLAAALFISSLLVYLVASRYRWQMVSRGSIAFALFLFGVCWHLQWAAAQLSEELPLRLEGESLRVQGVVIGLPQRTRIAQQFRFEILNSSTEFSPRTVVLNYYGEQRVEAGDYWQFELRLNRPHGFANRGGFDYQAWLFQQGISARGYVRQSAANQRIDSLPIQIGLALKISIHSWRQSIKARLQVLLKEERESRGLLIALLIGDRSSISQEEWSLFTATGSNHLFVISGLHIGMVSAFFYGLTLSVVKLFKRSSSYPAQKLAACVALISAFGYTLLAGFSLPTQRAFVMIAALMLGLFFSGRLQMSSRLLLAVLVVLLLNPLAIISSGFWLSFVAVAALIAFATIGQNRVGNPSIEHSWSEWLVERFRSHWVPQRVVLVALAVPLIIFTQQVSLLAPLVNVVAIPLVGFFIVPLCFLGLLLSLFSLAGGTLVLEFAHTAIMFLLESMNSLLDVGGEAFQLQITFAGLFNVTVAALASWLLLIPRGVCRRSMVVPLLFPLFPFPEPSSVLENRFTLRVHIIDVGQGLSALVTTDSHALLFDTGASLSPEFNLGSAVVLPVIRSMGIKQLDVVVVSHGDNDHAGGLSGIMSGIAVGRLISNSEKVGGSSSATLCNEVRAWNWDGVEFRFLHTDIDYPEENNNSCVLQIRLGESSVLLPGDIERSAEFDLVRRHGQELESDVLIAPHHGSASSSSYAFLKRVKPQYAVFSAGYRNSFGHPNTAVVARYLGFGAVPLKTAETGMISFEVSDSKSENALSHPKLYREQNNRYWR